MQTFWVPTLPLEWTSKKTKFYCISVWCINGKIFCAPRFLVLRSAISLSVGTYRRRTSPFLTWLTKNWYLRSTCLDKLEMVAFDASRIYAWLSSPMQTSKSLKIVFLSSIFPSVTRNFRIRNTSLMQTANKMSSDSFVHCATILCCLDCHRIKQPAHISMFPDMDFREGHSWLQSASENLAICFSPSDLKRSSRLEVPFKYFKTCFEVCNNDVDGLCMSRKRYPTAYAISERTVLAKCINDPINCWNGVLSVRTGLLSILMSNPVGRRVVDSLQISILE